LLSKGGNLYAALMLGIKVKDATAGFRAFRDTTVRKLEPSTCQASGYGFQIEMVWRAEEAGLDIVEVPIVFRDRTEGVSKMDQSIAIEAIRLVTRWGFRRLFRGNQR
jgi:dolichol-phosphate mannosyltransferase